MKSAEDIFMKGKELYKEGEYEEAHKCFQEASDMGFARAINAAGQDYLYGDGTEIDYQKALEYFTKAYEKGWEKAVINLAAMYYGAEELGIRKDSRKTAEYLKEAVRLGDIDSMALLSDFYYWGDPYYENDTLAIYYAQKVVEAGNPMGYRVLAFCFIDDLYLAKCPAYARYCSEQYAEDCGITLEEFLEEEAFEENDRRQILEAHSVKPPVIVIDDSDEYFTSYGKETLRDYQWAMQKLQGDYADGYYENVNPYEAEKLLIKSAEKGVCGAMKELAVRYRDIGEGSAVVYEHDGSVVSFGADSEKMLKYYTMAADQGDREAIESLIEIYEKGHGAVEASPESAKKYRDLLEMLY